MVQHLIKPVCRGPHCWHTVPAPPDADPAFWRETCCQCARHRDRTRHMAPWLGHGPYTPTRRWVDDPPPGEAPFTMQRTPEQDAAIQQRYGDDVSAEVQRLAAQIVRAGGINQVTLIQDPTPVPDDRQAAHDRLLADNPEASARATLARLATVAGSASGVLAYCGRCGELAAWCTCPEAP